MAHSENPQKAAEFFGVDDENGNYLAHSIRKIEREILNEQERHYHILTHVSKRCDSACILFSEKCCTIFLPSNSDEKSIRLALGHELGHLVFKFEELQDSKTLDNEKPTDEEEEFAWIFAYHLIDAKSKQHEHNKRIQKFVYESGELRRALSKVVCEKNPKLQDGIMKKVSA